MLDGVDKVLATLPDDAKVIPGHGPLSDKAGLRAFAEVLRGTIERRGRRRWPPARRSIR